MTDTPAPDRAPWVVVAVLGVLAAVLLVVTTVLALDVRNDDDLSGTQRERAEVLGVARQQATNLTSLTSADFEGGLARVRALSTGAFLADLEKTVAGLRASLSTASFEQKGTLLESGVSRLEGGDASVVLAVDQVVSSGQRSRTDALRLQLDLKRTDGTWLVDNVVFQPSTVSAQGPAPGAPSVGPSAGASSRPTASARPTATASPR